MNGIVHAFGTFSAQAAGLLVSSVWTGLSLVIFTGLLLRCLPRLSPGVRSAVWTAVLLLIVLLPVFSLAAGPIAAGEKGVVHARVEWSVAITAVWLALSLLRLLQLGVSALRLRSIGRRAVPVEASGVVSAWLQQGSRSVELCVSADVSRPSVAGFFRPKILLPAGLLEELSAVELEHVVLHEMEHLRRCDDWTNLLQKLSLALFPLHPALVWLDRRLCRERELACDDGVLRLTRARKAYAACLARLAEDSMVRRGLSLALGLLGMGRRGSELSGRVHRILRSPAAAMGRVQVAAAVTLVTAGVVGGCVVMVRSPRLVSFAAGAPEIVAHEDTVGTPVRSVAAVPEVLPKALPVKMVMPARPQQRPPMVKAVARVRKNSLSPLRRIAMEEPQQEPAFAPAPYVVFTAWEQPAMPHMTLTVARYTQDSPASFAAVAVRGGWVLIQL